MYAEIGEQVVEKRMREELRLEMKIWKKKYRPRRVVEEWKWSMEKERS